MNIKDKWIKKCLNKYGYIYDYSKVKYINSRSKICIICPIHGEFWQEANSHLQGIGCESCNLSHLEKEIEDILKKENVNFIKQQKFNWLKYKRLLKLDFYLPDYNIAIECQGIQHFKAINYFGGIKNLKYIKNNDKIKKELCEQNGVKLYYYSNLLIEYPYEVYEDKYKLIKDVKNERTEIEATNKEKRCE